MSNKNTAILTSLTNGQKFLIENPAAITDIVTFKAESDGLDSNIGKAKLAIKLLGKLKVVTAKDVAKYKADMSTTVLNIAKNALVKSRQLKNAEFINLYTLNADSISGYDKIVSVQKAVAILGSIELNGTLLNNILPEDYLAGKASIDLYDTMKDVPELNIKNKKSFGSAILKEALAAGRANIDNMKLLIDSKYSKTNIDYKNAFHLAVAIIVLGVRYSPTNITVIDSATGLIIDNVILELITKKGVVKKFVTDDAGIVPFKTHKSGETTYIAKRTGYPDTPITIKVKRGKTNDIVVVLKK